MFEASNQTILHLHTLYAPQNADFNGLDKIGPDLPNLLLEMIPAPAPLYHVNAEPFVDH